jgi:hypothetical protein
VITIRLVATEIVVTVNVIPTADVATEMTEMTEGNITIPGDEAAAQSARETETVIRTAIETVRTVIVRDVRMTVMALETVLGIVIVTTTAGAGN